MSTSEPTKLLTAIKKQIADKKIETWTNQENFLTHSPPQWNRRAWFKPASGTSTLTFFIVPPKGSTITPEIYAVYHDRLIEMLLAHFDGAFNRANASAMPLTGDIVKSSSTS